MSMSSPMSEVVIGASELAQRRNLQCKNKNALKRYEKSPCVDTLLARMSLIMCPVGASKGRISQVAVPFTSSTSSAKVNFVLCPRQMGESTSRMQATAQARE